MHSFSGRASVLPQLYGAGNPVWHIDGRDGAAFRLRWNLGFWDGGNVDIENIYEDREEAYARGFRASGRAWRFLWREKETNKDDFRAFIKREIDEGRPVIALGIIGPPEACIVCGHRNGGDTLLGWNFFQENPEFAGDAKIDESGYFISDSWWENPQTTLLMAIGEERGSVPELREILENAVTIMTKERVGEYAGGPAAYTVWAAALSDDKEFLPDAPLPQLFERLMCQTDAMTMVGEGRAYAALLMKDVAKEYEARGDKEISALSAKTAALFDGEFGLMRELWALPGFSEPGEAQARALTKPEIRKEIVSRIYRARDLDGEAASTLRALLSKLPR